MILLFVLLLPTNSDAVIFHITVQLPKNVTWACKGLSIQTVTNQNKQCKSFVFNEQQHTA